ncbi:MAG: site-2 protease family protein [Endomicrobium sp.]|jgi:Zn-dependent protease|nr:site-2 protease family protein [Endomicrobium sp.]
MLLPIDIIVYIVILFFSIAVHEVAHAYVAYLRGDDTAKMAGRITLNPIPHIELLGSIIVPTMLLILKVPVIFGWAKPVPINYRKLKNPRVDIPLISVAGPVSNMALSLLSAAGIRLIKKSPNFEFGFGDAIETFLCVMLTMNIILTIVNLIPVPPLDGSKIITYFLPTKIAAKFLNINSHICLIILFLLLSSGITLKFISYAINFLR